jgi:hypothetical protein
VLRARGAVPYSARPGRSAPGEAVPRGPAEAVPRLPGEAVQQVLGEAVPRVPVPSLAPLREPRASQPG